MFTHAKITALSIAMLAQFNSIDTHFQGNSLS